MHVPSFLPSQIGGPTKYTQQPRGIPLRLGNLFRQDSVFFQYHQHDLKYLAYPNQNCNPFSADLSLEELCNGISRHIRVMPGGAQRYYHCACKVTSDDGVTLRDRLIRRSASLLVSNG